MSKVTMPEPDCYRKFEYEDGEVVDVEYNGFDAFSFGRKNGEPLFTAAKMEAYAAAKVREALKAQAPYGYHIVSEANGNGVAFCPADHADAITEFLQAYPGTTIRALALIPQQ